jgi:membrane-associated phospholipid phosphatase
VKRFKNSWEMQVPMQLSFAISLIEYEQINNRVYSSMRFWMEEIGKFLLWDALAFVQFSFLWLMGFMYYMEGTLLSAYLDIGFIAGALTTMIVHAVLAGFKIYPFTNTTYNKHFFIEFRKYYGDSWEQHISLNCSKTLRRY